MLLTITTTHQPATDLGYLLHKNPARVQSFPLSFGSAHVFYSEATAECCTAALLLDVDAVALVRTGQRATGAGLEQYVNDRPYVASSFLSVAIAQVFGSALQGRSKDRPDLAETPLPLVATVTALPCRGSETILRRLFEPLGYAVTAQGSALDERFADWGASPYYTVRLGAICRLKDLLSHLYVLVPVLDNEKHYWVGEAEVEKLLRHGGDWLGTHPERELIAQRYLKYQRSLARAAMARLVNEEDLDPDTTQAVHGAEEDAVERPIRLHEQRLGAVVAVLKESGARRVLDLGAGSGKLLAALLATPTFEEIVGLDVSLRALQIAQERLHLDRLPPRQAQRVRLLHGSLMYRDTRLEGYDAAAVVEVIEHLDPPRLRAFGRVVFEFARPATVVLTTPNAEYNVKFENLPAGRFRHKDHRFEWTRREFQTWAGRIAEEFGYRVRFLPVGPEDATLGPPTQMGVFQRP